MTVVDYLSRLDIGEEAQGTHDNFSDNNQEKKVHLPPHVCTMARRILDRPFPPPKKVVFLILLMPSNSPNHSPRSPRSLCSLRSRFPPSKIPAPPPPPSHKHRLLYLTQKQPCRSSSLLLYDDGSRTTGSQASSRSPRLHANTAGELWHKRLYHMNKKGTRRLAKVYAR